MPSPFSPEFFAGYGEKFEEWWANALRLGEAINHGDWEMLDLWLAVAGVHLVTDAGKPLDYETERTMRRWRERLEKKGYSRVGRPAEGAAQRQAGAANDG